MAITTKKKRSINNNKKKHSKGDLFKMENKMDQDDKETLISSSSSAKVQSKVIIETMSLSRLVEGQCIYGCIQEVDDFELKFSLTGGIMVTVPIINISDAYSKLIENFTKETLTVDEVVVVAKLASLFQIGDYYPVRILSKKVCDQFGHTEIVGSINPKDIYNQWSKNSIRNLPQNYTLVAAVTSLEDYGYEMDLGISDVKAFLPLQNLSNKSGGGGGRGQKAKQPALNIGQLLYCSVEEIKERTILLTPTDQKASKALELDDESSVQHFIPGTRTKCIVANVHPSGLELDMPGGYKGFVSRYHLHDSLMASSTSTKFKIGDTVEGFVLYVQLHTKQVCISLKSLMTKKKVINLTRSIKLGLIIENATVWGKGSFGITIFRLSSSDWCAFALRKNLCDPDQYDENELNQLFAVGTSHRCRVKKFHLFDNLIEVSLRKSFIERKELTFDDLYVGAIVEGTVKKHHPRGIYVRLGFGINGFIPNIHLTDAPMQQNFAKNIVNLFPEKKKIRCRITRLDTSSRVPKISLTTKKTLLGLPQSEILLNWQEVKPGMSSTGVICLISDKGILIEFFGWLRGFVPLKYLATYKIEHPDKVFTIGQNVKCKVVSVDSSACRMVCSLVDFNETKPSTQLNTKNKSKKSKNCTLKVGQILHKMRIVSKNVDKGLDLANNKEDIQVFLSLAHLSDDPYQCRVLFAAYQVGDVIDQMMVFSIDSAHVVRVTRKQSFLSEPQAVITKEDDIELGQPFLAIVRNVTNKAVFFETPNFCCGVVWRKFLQDGFYEDPIRLNLVRGQTIYVVAIEVAFSDQQKQQQPLTTESSGGSKLKRFKFSMKLSDIWDQKDTAKTQLMQHYLMDYSLGVDLLQTHVNSDTMKQVNTTDDNNSGNHLVQTMAKLMSYSIGQVVTYVVTNIGDATHFEVNISLTGTKNEPTVRGLAPKYTDFGELQLAHMGNAVVCDVDLDRKVLLVFIQPQPAKLVRHVKNVTKSDTNKSIKVGQSIKGTVIYVGSKYVLTILAGHAPGVIAYVPAKRHLNDLSHIELLFTIGEEYHFVVRHIEQGNRVIVTLNTETKKLEKKKVCERKKSDNEVKSHPDKVSSTSSSKPVVDDMAVVVVKSTIKHAPSQTVASEITPSSRKVDITAAATVVVANNESKQHECDFQWDIPELSSTRGNKRKIDCLTGANVVDSTTELDVDAMLTDSSSDDSNTSDESDGDGGGGGGDRKKRRHKHQTREQRNEEARQREFDLRQKEIELSNTERTPQNEQDFEMAVLGSPNSSLVWLKYMSFFLAKGDIGKARQIADRALQRISFREEQEKLNIWIGLINLENTYGDQASMDALVEKAIKYNDTQVIYLQLANIYDSSNKKEKAEQVFHLLVKKFRQQKNVWIEFLHFYMRNDRQESARKLFQKSLLSLEKRDHVDVISKFAQLEFRYGDSEQAKTIFESMLATYWKRLDQWSIYVDMLVKYTLDEKNLDSVEYIRNVFERLITFKLPPQKMKFVFKKYYDFEQKYSAENCEILDRIKQKAFDYLECDIF